MELQVWQGDWGIPSVDTKCLAVMAYCKFAEAPITFNKTNNPWPSPNGQLPILVSGNDKIVGVKQIFNHLRKEKLGTDYDLSGKQSADIVAVTALLEDKLLPALALQWWVDEQNYTEVMRPWYAKALPFPLNFFLPGKYNRQSKSLLEATFISDHYTDLEREKHVYKNAKECLNMLSTMLGNKTYFFGGTPSSLDAIVFGYLSPLLKAPLKNLILQSHVQCCTNLVSFCQRILQSHFPLSAEELEQLREKEQTEREKRQKKMASEGDDPDFPHKKRNIMLAGLFAITAMTAYAFLSGIISIEITESDSSSSNSSASSPPKFFEYEPVFQDEQKEEEETQTEE